jgi:hypothetical protein
MAAVDDLWRAQREFLGRAPGWQVTGLTWDQARSALLAELREFMTEEDCGHCLGQARAAIAALTALPPGAALRENVDGTDCVLEKVAEGVPFRAEP